MTRARAFVTAAICLLSLAVGLWAATEQTPTPPGQTQQPVFRAGVDVIQLDISVLDKKRRPIHGLTEADFTILENGKVQRLVGVAEVVAPDPADSTAAWLRLVSPDVDTNSLNDRIRGGQVMAIVIDDTHLPFDSPTMLSAAKDIAHGIVDRLGALDTAAVVYTRDSGRTQDFTSDRRRLHAAVDALTNNRQIPGMLPFGSGMPAISRPGSGDAMSGANVNSYSRCELADPTIPALRTLTQYLAQIPQRRKTIMLVSVGDGGPFAPNPSACMGQLRQEANDMFSQAQRANVNIYTIDPAGLHGGESYRLDRGTEFGARVGSRSDLDSLAIFAESTGGRAVTNTNAFDGGLDQIFEENASYYLVGYQTTNPQMDGKIRKVDVKVGRPDVTARYRRSYYGLSPNAAVGSPGSSAKDVTPLTPSETSAVGLQPNAPLAMRVSAAAFALPEHPTSRLTAVALTLALQEQPPRSPQAEQIELLTSTEDADGHTSGPRKSSVSLTLEPNLNVDARYEISSRLDLLPGRYSIRLNAHSLLLDKNGTVYAEVDVPDFSRAALSLSGLVLSAGGVDLKPGVAPAHEAIAAFVPVLPTTEQSFIRGGRVTAFLRLYQSGQPAALPVTMALQILDGKGASKFERADTLAADGFTGSEVRAADYKFDLPTGTLTPGPHLLNVTAKLPDGTSVRRDLLFTVR